MRILVSNDDGYLASGVEDIVRALDMGANDYITKPIDFAVALARVRTQLSLRRTEEARRETQERYALRALSATRPSCPTMTACIGTPEAQSIPP